AGRSGLRSAPGRDPPRRRQPVPRRTASAGGDRAQAGRWPPDPQRARPRGAGAVRPAPDRQGLRPGVHGFDAAVRGHPRRRPGAGVLPVNLIAFETATEACSVAIWRDGEVLERFEVAPRRHAELALPWAQELLSEAGLARAQLDAVAVGRGPGAFTGVRLGVGLAQGIALALDVPVVPVSTLAVLAARAPGGRVLAAIDARMGEVYLGRFQLAEGGVDPLGDRSEEHT